MNNKKMFKWVAFVLFILFCIIENGNCESTNIPIQGYEKIKWGMSKENIIHLYKNKEFLFKAAHNRAYEYSLNVYDIREECDAYLEFQFNDNALDSVVIYYKPSSEGFITVANFDNYTKQLIGRFGKPMFLDTKKTIDILDGKQEKRHLWKYGNIYISLTIKQEDNIMNIVENYTTEKRVIHTMELQKKN